MVTRQKATYVKLVKTIKCWPKAARMVNDAAGAFVSQVARVYRGSEILGGRAALLLASLLSILTRNIKAAPVPCKEKRCTFASLLMPRFLGTSRRLVSSLAVENYRVDGVSPRSCQPSTRSCPVVIVELQHSQDSAGVVRMRGGSTVHSFGGDAMAMKDQPATTGGNRGWWRKVFGKCLRSQVDDCLGALCIDVQGIRAAQRRGLVLKQQQ